MCVIKCYDEYCNYCDEASATPIGGKYMPCIYCFPCCCPCILLFDIICCPCYMIVYYDSYDSYNKPSQPEVKTAYNI